MFADTFVVNKDHYSLSDMQQNQTLFNTKFLFNARNQNTSVDCTRLQS